MELKPGSRWRSAVCEAEFVVVRPAKTPVSLECGGQSVIPHAEARDPSAAPSADHAAGSAAGKRYSDADTGLEVLCSKAGAGSLSVDGRAIGAQEAKKLPSSD
ncbi:hypothetical protein [Phenylobacterium sp. SCN 70-31]|uniref:hypothetical protein n=1 Tax=Phenylobacterium sp. SCN 70-31 TaxID=1660129 RepID=UPI00086A1DD8|nr:hypothetical protein [Phenylobacterium sp. SCN 70-31]ODT86965.1 MAG: hypothetical protein ABS78_13960 [Phenylobacterium sp. SCN 70-31]